jgi:hypothetical protein
MALLGTGMMTFWNNIAKGGDDEYVEWHVLEHIPERVGIPGFLRGRRYIGVDGEPAYFNFYETADASVLTSPAYLERLNSPSDWTRLNLTRFEDSNRTLCRVAYSIGQGEGAAMETLRMTTDATPDAFKAALKDVLQAISKARGVVGVHLLEGLTDASRAGTAEKKLRSQPDQIADWVVLIEAVDADSLKAARKGAAADSAFKAAGATGIARGIYLFQYGLSKAEIERNTPGPKRWATE